MKSLVLTAWAVLAALLLTGCAEKAGRAASVRIVPSIQTRVTGLYFDAGDRIGLTVMMDGSGPYVENRMMTYNGSTFTSPGFLWYNDLNVTSTLTAYYPYSATGTPEEFHIETDQTAGCASSDLLGAVKRGVTPASAPVGMVFYHLFTQLSIRVNNVSDASVTGITVGGTVTTAAVDLSVPTASALEGAAAEEITVFTVTPDEEYRVILVPQQGTLTVTVRTDDGKSRSRTISSTLLESGKRYDLSVEVTNIDISLSLSGEISDWEDGGSLDDGNGGSGSGDVTVTDGTISHAGETYRTVAIDGRLWMAENLRCMPEGAALGSGVWNPAGGASAVSTQGMLYDYATATAGESWSEGVQVQGICPPGWHLPDEAELTALAASAARPDDVFVCGGFWIYGIAGDRLGSTSKGYVMGSTLQDGKCSCLMFTSLDNDVPQVTSISAEFGLTVRCVQD